MIAALLTLFRGARGDPSGSAIAAAFLALLLHTMLYADFLEDPSPGRCSGSAARWRSLRAPAAGPGGCQASTCAP